MFSIKKYSHFIEILQQKKEIRTETLIIEKINDIYSDDCERCKRVWDR